MQKRVTEMWMVPVLVIGFVAAILATRGVAEDEITIVGPGSSVPRAAKEAPVGEGAAGPASARGAGQDGVVPVGSVVGWMKNLERTPNLPDGWVECNGQKLDLPGSAYHGITIPNLNGAGNAEKRFLRGSTESGGTGGAEQHVHGTILVDRDVKKVINVAAKTPASNLPPYCEVTWIMRVM